MKRLALLPLLLASVVNAAPAAEPYCKRLPFDAEVPAGLTGKYAIVGRQAASGHAYSGTLEISVANGSYALRRTVGGTTLQGEAWVESCSADHFPVLRARYATKPQAVELSCFLRMDGDNYTRASCTTVEGGGLEAWYQEHAAP